MSGGTLTRILNNQITNSTIIASQKIAAGTITGSLFSSNVTVPGDFLITGNLFVLGSSAYTTIASTNTYVNDPLIVLNNGFSGTNTYDEGFVFNRGTLLNQAFIWSEANKEFRLLGTTETGTTYGSVAVSNFANLHVGNLTVDYAVTVSTVSIGNLNVSGNILASSILATLVQANNGTFGNVSAGTVGNVGTVFTGASINLSGNVLATGGVYNALTVNGNETVTGYLNVTGNVMAKEFTGNSLNVTGNVLTAQLNAGQINTTGNVLAQGGVFNAMTVNGNVNVTGNVLSAGAVYNNLAVNGNTSLGLAGAVSGSWTTVVGNITQTSSGGAVYFNTTGNVMAAVGQFGAINSTGFINTSGNISAAVSTAGSYNTTGNILAAGAIVNALTVNGNESVTGYLNVTGNVVAAGAVVNALTVNGNESVTGYLNVTGNVMASAITGASLNVSGNVLGAAATFSSSQINGNESVTGYLNVTGNILGSAGTLNTLALNSTANATEGAGASGALQIKGGVSIAQDLWVGGNVYAGNIIGVTANVITVQDPLLYLRPASIFPYNYDIGIYSGFQGTGLTTAGNIYQHTAVFRDPLTNTWTFASNLAEPSASYITLDATTIYDPIKAGNLNLVNTTASTTTGTGALIVAGGAGIGGSLYARDIQATVIGNTTPAAGTFTTITAGSVSSGFIGNTGTAFTGASLNVSGNVLANSITTSTLILQTLAIPGNLIAGLSQFASINATPIGNATPSTGVFTTATAGAVNAPFIGNTGAVFTGASINITGNVLAAAGVYNTLTVNGNESVTGYLNVTGNILGSQVNAGTLTVTGNAIVGLFQAAAINSTPIGNTTASTGAFTTLSATASLYANSTAASTNFTNGALVVAGGVGINGNLNISGNNRITLGGDLVANLVYPENFVQVVANANSAVRYSITNLNSGTAATAEFTAINNVGSNVSGYIATGIASTNNIQTLTFIKPKDGYTYVNGGNLALGSSSLDTVVFAGGNIISRFSAVNSNLSIVTPVQSTSSTSGALTVVGGVGIGGNIFVANGAVINSNRTTDTFKVLSATGSNVAIFANLATTYSGSTEYVVIGGGNTAVQPGVTLKVGSQTTMMVPVGPSSARPSTLFGAGYDVAGMLRFNSTTNVLEYYDGSVWQIAGSTFTVISDRQMSGNVGGGYGNVDGTNTTFTLQSNATTAGTLVSINGIMQFPTLAYSVSGTTLTFTEPPAPNDVIDVRIITTTSTVTALSSGSGLNQFIADTNALQFWTGASSSTLRANIDQSGNFNFVTGNKVTYDQTPVQVTNTNLTLLDSFSANAYTTAKYVISMKQGTGNVQAMESMITTNGLNAWVTTYGVVNTGNNMGTLAANVSGGTCSLWLVPLSGTAISNVKVMTTYIV